MTDHIARTAGPVQEAHSATELAGAIHTEKFSALDAVEACLANTAHLEGDVKAWIHLDADGARQRARDFDDMARSDPRRQRLMAGVPVGLKDNIDTADMPTAYGTGIYTDARPFRDAACVAQMRLAGANPLGKTASTEFAHRHPGATRNPWELNHTPGGSSSGSAAAVAAGMVPVALGTQTTGSVIRPAAYCGVFGYKPSFGDINVSGVLANTPSFDTVGIMARCVDDLLLVRRAILDESVSPAPVPDPQSLRIGICRTPYWDEAEADMKQLLEQAGADLERAGASVFDFHDQGAFVSLDEANITVSGYEFARTLAFERMRHYDKLSPVLREGRMADGLRVTYAEYAAAQRRLAESRTQLDHAFHNVDFVITPPSPGAAPAGIEFTGSATFNQIWTSMHTPAITLPISRNTAGLPLGLQIANSRYEDDKLLAIARWVARTLMT